MFTSRRLAPPRTCSSATSTRLLEVARLDQPPEPRRAGDVRALADHDEVRVRVVIANGSRPLKRVARAPLGHAARRHAVDGGGDRADVLGRRAAAAADDVDEPVARELAEEAARVGGLLVVAAERVREARVRMAARPRSARRRASSSTNGRISVAPSEQLMPTTSGARVLDRDPERLDRLPGEGAAAAVDRGEREPERQAPAPRPARRRSRPCRSACRRSSRSGAGRRRRRAGRGSARVRLAHLVEGDRRGSAGSSTRGESERRDVERADRAGDEARPLGRARRPLVGGARARAARPRRSSRGRRPRARSPPARSTSR